MEDARFLRSEAVRLRSLAGAAASRLAREEMKRMATQYEELADLIELIERTRHPAPSRTGRPL